MLAIARTLFLMIVAPPVLLLLFAHFAPRTWQTSWFSICLTAVVLGLAGIATSPWRLEVKLVLGLLYALAAVPIMPFLGLFASCSTGNCL